jgi:hypothetical protein
MSIDRRDCPDCEGTLHEVKLLDQAHASMHVGPLEYALPEAKRSMWSGRFPVAGTVQAYLCEDCGRIFLYSAARET